MTVEALVRVVSKTNPIDPIKDAELTKFGDVIVVKPENWGWSTEEYNNPDWIIVRIRNMEMAEAEAYLSPQAGDARVSRYLKRRAVGWDEAKLSAFLAGMPQPINYIITANASQVRKFVYVKAIDNSLVL